MLDLSVIILTYNEEMHIQRCVENMKSIAKDVFIVDSYSTDATLDIAKESGATIFQNKWENNYAKQFNWALENLPIQTKWVLRLDADEYCTQELIEELKEKLPIQPDDVTGILLKRRHYFLGKWIKKGVYPVKLLRIFRYKKAFCEQRLMDEHIQITEGRCVEFQYDFVDYNLNNISWWSIKHVGYAIREAADLLDIEYNLKNDQSAIGNIGVQAHKKRKLKESYVRKPLFLRPFLYFIYRYIVRLGFTEGKEAFLWHFLQGWWYRTLVDAKVWEVKRACGSDKKKIRDYLKEKYQIDI
ncbi:glycosyltransferase involved in cell wall biosynthesis [Parabacteroides sp. PFB2-10]|uniref:glycosyltransferase family 2 protein n=1 Tax=Parabacteroides sp. PFB2-10 TaxID=1742405 RepID=UPI0024739A10|nr:glycosyltransferase family 2 protein [Parabacteroides sp. PFB2-10]MDH6312730.1 glycosyltransferase involved in cell wall biosynthesis [Parabacteroides sp. PFB2-10]